LIYFINACDATVPSKQVSFFLQRLKDF